MKKRILALLMAGALALGLTACGGGDTSTDADTTADSSSDTAAATGIAADKLKVGLILVGEAADAYNKNHIDGMREACQKNGMDYDSQVVVKANITEDSTCADAINELLDAGCNAIFADSFGHEQYMEEAAPDHPDVQFCHATGYQGATDTLDNTHNYFAKIFEARYLAGIAAGLKLNEMIDSGKITADKAKMGYVGAFTYAEVISGYTSFFLGARSVCPTVTMDVTFTGSWYDETLEKEGAEKLIQGGCKLISQHADSLGAPTACENAGVPNVSYNGSTKDSCPNTFIVSSRIDWAPYYEMCIKAVMDGTEIPADWTGTLATGSVVLTDVNETAAAAGTAEAIAAATEKLEKGEIHVFDCANFTTKVDDKVNTFKADYLKLDEAGHITSYMADVDTDAAYTGDTEVIKDGYFAESEFRSAPYFDLQIDGINLLDTAM